MSPSASDQPPAAPARAVADGVWAIEIPLAGTAIRSVNVHALAHAGGLLLVDAGYEHDTCWRALLDGITATGHRVEDVTDVVLTHNHPDHVGLAPRVQEASGARVAIPALDALAPSQRRFPLFFEQLDAELGLAGVPDDVREAMIATSRTFLHRPDLLADRLLEDGDVVETGGIALEVVATPGHTRGHVALLDRAHRTLLGGDLLLTTGEVQLGLVAFPDDDPVSELLASLARVAALPVEALLGGHGGPIHDVARAAAQASADLEARVERTRLDVLARPGLTCWERCDGYPWARPWADQGELGRRFSIMQLMGWQRRLASTGAVSFDAGPPERLGAPVPV